ncbi:MAG: TauD/TfdA family dioxygenase [Gammaproteobacteria bacterium]|nr:TauD/TfdA family dioxygenase [Gammaproteobacteria bacterium]
MLDIVKDPGLADVEYIDLSFECTSVLEQSFDDKAWTGDNIEPPSCVTFLDQKCLSEIHSIASRMQENPLPDLLRSPDQFDLPHLRNVMQTAKSQLNNGNGVAVIDALPIDDMDETQAMTVFWIVGQLIGRPVAQKWDGTMLYQVKDTGMPFGYGVRGSYTNIELTFHTDNAFAITPPETVGLLCLRPALSGGVSRFCSLYAVHNELLQKKPSALSRLYQPVLWDRQAEHAPDKPRFSIAPMFRFDGKKLLARANTGLVRKSYERAEVEMDSELSMALDCVDEITDRPGFHFELPLERGQMQYLNNRDVAHYRSEFQDHPEPAQQRHLVRTWHRESGQRTYDGF